LKTPRLPKCLYRAPLPTLASLDSHADLLISGIGKNTTFSLAPWRILFLICGALTSAMGVVFFFAMPSGPDTAWFFTPREREVAALRLARDHEGGDKTNFSMPQLLEALTDIKSWLAFSFGVLVTMPSPVLTVCFVSWKW